MIQKPKFEVDINVDSPSSLEAHNLLSLILEKNCFHLANGFRHPLGIYNISVSRVCEKVKQLCIYLERYFNETHTLEALKDNEELKGQVIDYIELTLYSAAEHVDDVYSIASGFFVTKAKAKKSPHYKELDKSIKEHKKFIATATNHLKHQQSRIRMFSLEFRQESKIGCLHGYFFEAVENGVLHPSKTIHKGQDVHSVTTLIWEILYLLLNLSRNLALFLNNTVPQIYGPTNIKSRKFSEAVVAAARLPIYTFGEEHPFARATITISSLNNDFYHMDSGVYGSIKHGWSKKQSVYFGGSVSSYEGDGTTRSFRLINPQTITFQHWD